MKTAKFSTGEVMVRKSHTRDYRFAWAIIQNGKIVTKGGFSETRENAEAAGRTHLNRCNGDCDRNTRNYGIKKYYACPVNGARRRAELDARREKWAGAVVEVVPVVDSEGSR